MKYLTPTRLSPVLLLTMLLVVFAVSSSQAAPSTDASVSEYSQCTDGTANDAFVACNSWINGILNAQNSTYHEDEVTPQRLFLDLPNRGPITGRTITLKYLDRKGQGGVGNHAYDSLAQWNYTQTGADRCQSVTAANCPGGTESKFTIPVDNTSVNDTNGGASTATHELPDANRYVSMFGGTITNVTAPSHDNAAGSGDDYASITITYSVTSTPTKVELLFGGHLAASVGTRGWGSNVGASFINGGPYHIKLTGVDTSSIGNRDNQITSGAILPQTTAVTTALHQTGSTGTDVSPANNQGTSDTGITVNLPTDGTGAYVTDYATVNPSSATGTVDFRYYSSSTDCTAGTNASEGGTTAGSGKTLDASGVAKSDAILFTSITTVYWRAFFQATGNSVNSSSGCSEEVLTVNQNTSTSTTLHQTDSAGADVTVPVGGNNGDPITVPVGAYVTDYAALTPGSATGSVSFRYYSSSTACSGDTTGTGGSDGGSAKTVSTGSATSDTKQFTSSGDFYWKAFFTGSSSNNDSASSCEHLIVQKASPTVASDPRLIPQDHAVLAGISAGGSPQATITFSLYGPGDPGCTGSTNLYSEQQNVTGNGEYTTLNSGNPTGTPAGFRLTHGSTHGVYHWKVSYSGDSANNANSSCDEAFDFEGITDRTAS